MIAMRKNILKVNSFWKWAFFILLLVNIVVFGYIFNLFFGSRTSTEADISSNRLNKIETVKQEEQIEATISLNGQELQLLLQTILEMEADQQQVPNILITDSIILTGEIELLGFPLEYFIEAEPFTTNNGNLQLKVAKVNMGSLSLPIEQSLEIIQGFFNPSIPVEVNASEHFLVILLSDIKTDYFEGIELKKIDKEKQEYTFNISIASKNLLQ